MASVTNAFSADVTSLASGVNSALAGAFNNTNVKTASTTSTAISDPLATLQAGKVATSTPFSLTSFSNSSSAASSSTSAAGSLSAQMTGTQLSTVLDRYNLNSTNLVSTTVASATQASLVSGLLSSVASVTSSITATVGAVAKAVTSTVATVNHDVALFTAQTSALSNALGGGSIAGQYIPATTTTLLSSTGSLVNTNNSGVDSITANAIVGVANASGCTTATTYQSYSAAASALATALTTAATSGLSDLTSSLVGCSVATTPLGQTALTNAFTAASTTQIGTASTILGGIAAPLTLNTPAITSGIITNQNLTAADAASVNSVMTSLGTTTETAYSIPGPSYPSPGYLVIDSTAVSNSSSGFVDASFGDSTLTDFGSAVPMSTTSTGSLDIATYA
jgi:hypothetical protein